MPCVGSVLPGAASRCLTLPPGCRVASAALGPRGPIRALPGPCSAAGVCCRRLDVTFTPAGAALLPSLPLCRRQTPAWLEQMIAHTTWRDLFYKLAEAHPDCLMLNFTVKVGGRESGEGQGRG